jgi:2,3-bisphosphoglycerate-independent phosphoglycerate mutase
MKTSQHPVMLIVLDGWGHSDTTSFNAIHAANTPTWDALKAKYPHSVISCSGNDVGLPAGQMGNSEVGHMHLGAGRTIFQDFSRISNAIANDEFAANDTLRAAFEKAAKTHKAVHILGLLSPGGVHSHEDHLVALMSLAKDTNVERVYLHAFLDGRDTPPKSAQASIEKIVQFCETQQCGHLASLCGRFFAMDRNNNWDRIAQAYELMVNGEAEFNYDSGMAALDAAYGRGETDEFVQPSTIQEVNGNIVRVEDGDVMVFANFRADRARQITEALSDPTFTNFPRSRAPALAAFVTMTQYSEKFDLPVAFPPFDLPATFGEIVADNGLRQLRIAETEKYAHVTFFFNGGIEQEFSGEDRILIQSPDVLTYDLKPEMSAPQLTDALVASLESGKYETIICNYANADMVGHTGNYEATIACIEALDKCLERVLKAARKANFEILITADHGNAEKMRAEGTTEDPHTAHTSNLVPLIYVGRHGRILPDGCLSDIAPTMLALMGLEKPVEMTGRSLVELLDKQQNAA